MLLDFTVSSLPPHLWKYKSKRVFHHYVSNPLYTDKICVWLLCNRVHDPKVHARTRNDMWVGVAMEQGIPEWSEIDKTSLDKALKEGKVIRNEQDIGSLYLVAHAWKVNFVGYGDFIKSH